MEVRNEYKATDDGMVPNDWLILSVQNLTPKNKKYAIVDGPFGSNLKTVHYRKSGIPIITSGYVTDGKFFADEYLFVDENKFKEEKRSAVNGGDIVMAKIGERCGASAILPRSHQTGILSGNALKITIDENKYSCILIWQILWNKHIRGKLEVLRTTGAQPALSIANLKKFELAIPPTLIEQTAIATALSDADALISSLEKLIAKKRNIKQGAMQQLLQPKEGWEVKKLGEVSEIFRGGSPRPIEAFLTTNPNGINWIKIGDVGKGAKYIESTAEKIIAEGMSRSRYVHEGDFLLSNSMSFGRPYILKTDGCIHDGWLAIQNYQVHFDREFLYYLLGSQSVLVQYKAMASGSSVLNLNKEIVKNVLVGFPGIDEQVRIASILADMDNEIAVLESKLEKCQQIKQGMMQQLLTGKIRLVN